jgi:hypothetical protein
MFGVLRGRLHYNYVQVEFSPFGLLGSQGKQRQACKLLIKLETCMEILKALELCERFEIFAHLVLKIVEHGETELS